MPEDEEKRPVAAEEPEGSDAVKEASEPKGESAATPSPTRKKSEGRVRKTPVERESRPAKKAAGPKAPNRPTLDAETHRLLTERTIQDGKRPLFVRQQAHRYYVLGRVDSWRRPRGLQSKQRRHYGYRPTVVSIGFGSPRATRGLTPSGFEPVLVRTSTEVESLEPARQAALIARTVGTRRRLVLEEVARKKGIHVLNPLLRERPGEV